MGGYYAGISYGEFSSNIESYYLGETLGAEFGSPLGGSSGGILGKEVEGMTAVMESTSPSIWKCMIRLGI